MASRDVPSRPTRTVILERWSVTFLGLLILLLFTPCLAGDDSGRDTILIKNVRLIDREGQAEDRTVNILIRDMRLDIVTRDAVPAEAAMLLLDGANGVLLGNLEIGQPSSFLILDEDPREDFNILLDTKAHAVFAIHKGTIVRNNLRDIKGSELEKSPVQKRKWFAYTPPPRSLPVSYGDRTKWNRWNTRYTNGVFLGAVLLDRQFWLSQDEASSQQVGDLTDFEGGKIRALRAGAVGTLNFERPWLYTFFAATRAFDKGFDAEDDDSIILYDYRLDIPLTEKLSLAVGKQKEPISMERLMPLSFWPMQERTTVSDGLLPSRNVGMVLSGSALDQRVTWAGGAFNNWFDTGQSFSESSNQFIGRTTWLPLLSEDESHVLHLGLGVRYQDGKEPLRYRASAEFDKSPLFVDTDLLEADHVMAYNPEASWRLGPFWFLGEAVINDVNAPEVGNPLFHGYHLTGSWSLTGEMRPYNRRSGVFGKLPVARPVTEGGWGAWELSTRWSRLDLTQRQVEGGEVGVFSLGLNWWPVQAASVSANYRNIALNRFGIRGKSHGLSLRLLLMLE